MFCLIKGLTPRNEYIWVVYSFCSTLSRFKYPWGFLFWWMIIRMILMTYSKFIFKSKCNRNPKSRRYLLDRYFRGNSKFESVAYLVVNNEDKVAIFMGFCILSLAGWNSKLKLIKDFIIHENKSRWLRNISISNYQDIR